MCDTNKRLCVTGKIKFQTALIYDICQGCSSNDDCKGPIEKCDPFDHICRIQCTRNKDCKGGNMMCDTNKRLCVTGKIYFLTIFVHNLMFRMQ